MVNRRLHTLPPSATAFLRLERIILLITVASITAYLFLAHNLRPYSDCVEWFGFGKDFLERFGRTKLAYGFPALIAAARPIMGADYVFLVNIPVFALFFLGIFYLAKQSVPAHFLYFRATASCAGFLSIFLFIANDRWILRYLSNPYRDPLSYVLIIAATLCLIQFRASQSHRLSWAFASGTFLALASSTRETSVLMILPFALYGIEAKVNGKSIPVAKACVSFILSFMLFMLPYFYQTYLTTGNILIPAQLHRSSQTGEVNSFEHASSPGKSHLTAEPAEREESPVVLSSLVNPFKITSLLNNAGEMAGYLIRKFRKIGVFFMFVGFLVGMAYRQSVVVTILCPSLLMYLLLYTAYGRLIPRYLFSIDMFAYVLIATGAAWLFHYIARYVNSSRIRSLVLTLSLALFPAWTVFLSANSLREDDEAFQIRDMQRLRADISALVPEGARIFGDRPLGEIVRCFFDRKSDWSLDYLGDLLTNPDSDNRFVHDTMHNSQSTAVKVHGLRSFYESFFLFRSHEYKHYVGNLFDLLPSGNFSSADYSLRHRLKVPSFYLDRIEPWKKREVSLAIEAERPGMYILSVGLGKLSQFERSFFEASFGGKRWSKKPLDGRNYYALTIDSASGPGVFSLGSDGYLPALPTHSLGSIQDPIIMDFSGYRLNDYIQRFSPSVKRSLRRGYPIIESGMYVDIPTVEPDAKSLYIVRARTALAGSRRASQFMQKVFVEDDLVYEGTLSKSADDKKRGPWTNLTFYVGDNSATESTTRLSWDLDPPARGGRPSSLELESLKIYRHVLEAYPSVSMGARLSGLFLVSGFHNVSHTHGTSVRWTEGRAAARLLMLPDSQPKRLHITYLTGARPDGVPDPSPVFELNGEVLPGRTDRKKLDARWNQFTFTSILAPSQLINSTHDNLLEIHSGTWSPAEEGSSKDRRTLGVMIEKISLSPP